MGTSFNFNVFVSGGKLPSRWQGSGEFELFVESYAGSNACFALGDPSEMTIETPFGGHNFIQA